jgi:hypothetical protein
VKTQAATHSPPHTPAQAPDHPSTPTSSHPAGPNAASRRSPAVRPQQREAFENALRRQRLDDEPSAPSPSQPQAASPNSVTTLLPPRQHAGGDDTAGSPPRTAAAQDAVSTHLRALGAASPLAADGATAMGAQGSASTVAPNAALTSATQAHWQLQWAGASAPVQQVDMHRTDSGALHLDMTGHAFASDPARLARLRDRVAARSQASQVIELAYTRVAQRQPGATRHHPWDNEGDEA